LIKAVFFDFDGVLTTDKTGSFTTARYVSQKTGISISTVKAAFARHNGDLTLGKKTHSQIWSELCADIGREIDISLLQEAFESTPLNRGMLSLAHTLKKSHSVGIITDNKKDRIDHLKLQHNLDSLFSPIVVSAEVGFNKASTEIFLHALRKAGVRAEEAVFVDNNRLNLVTPSALGMNAVFHDDESNDIDALVETFKELGVLAG
jgi:HAD superfamily hydrolase (TIGR01509 family)